MPTIVRSRRLLLPVVLLGPWISPPGAQQFREVPGALPAKTWSEGVECADVDGDGDLDLFVAEGEGQEAPGRALPQRLWINLLESEAWSFADESAGRLGVYPSHAKGVTTGDVDGDGWIDALFANAFMTAPPHLYVNRGGQEPGFFDLESEARGLGARLSSSSAAFGDLDHDGDLDCVLNDGHGNSTGTTSTGEGAGAPSGRLRIYRNDGTGVFAEDTSMGEEAPVKAGHRDVQIADVNGDWALDILGTNRVRNRGGNHFLLLNDKKRGFVDASLRIPGGTDRVYELEPADLDGDRDVDLFVLGLAGDPFDLLDGALVNTVVARQPTFAPALPSGGGDDNEVCLLDADNDGDLDAFLGSLGPSEQVLVNDGRANFTAVPGIVQPISDPTLDCTACDLDGDGDYDLVTVQGESRPARWGDRVYMNTGGRDTRPPVIVRQEPVRSPCTGGPWRFRTEVRDQVMDDGRSWLTGDVHYVVQDERLEDAVSITGGGFSPSILRVAPGTTVTWTNNDLAVHTVTSLRPGHRYGSPPLQPAATYSMTFVTPGTYAYGSAVGATARVEVVGEVSRGVTTESGGGIFLHRMEDTRDGRGRELSYEVSFVDAAGNATHVTRRRKLLCGVRPYAVDLAEANPMDLEIETEPSVGTPLEVRATGLPFPEEPVLMVLALRPALGPMPDSQVLLVDLARIYSTRVLEPGDAGEAGVGVGVGVGGVGTEYLLPDAPDFCGAQLFLQAFQRDPERPARFQASKALEVTVCP